MAGRVIGTAEIQVTANTKRFDASLSGIGKNIASALETPLGKAASNISNRMGQIGQSISSGMQTVLGGAAVAIGGFLTTALVTGYDRFTTIEDATARLTVVLGSATDASALLGDVLAVIEGTPFRLDQFANASAMLVSFGVDAQKVPGYMEAIGEAASSMGKRAPEAVDMITTAFSQMQSQGRVTGDALWTLGQVGVDAATILGNHFGVTAEEARKMVSEGMVPAEEGMDALAKGIIEGSEGAAGATRALGGQMEALGTTLSGSLANMRASVARFGARIWKELAPGLTPALQGIEQTIDNAAGPIGDAIGAWINSPGVQKFLDWVANDLPNQVGPFIDKITELGDVVGPLLGGAFAFAGKGIQGFLGPFGALLPTINPVVGILAGLILSNEDLRDTFMDLLKALEPVVKELSGAFMDALEELMPSLVEMLENLAPVVLLLGESFADAIILLLPILVELTQMVVDFIAALPPPLIAAIAAALAMLWLVGFGPVGWVMAGIMVLIVLFNAFKEDIIRIFNEVMNWLSENWPLLLAIIAGPIGLIVLLIVENWDKIYAFIKNIVTMIGDWISTKFTQIKDWIGEKLTQTKEKIAQIWNSIYTWIQDKLNAIGNWIRDKWEAIKNWIGDKLNATKAKIQEIWNAIYTWVTDKITGLGNSIRDKFESIKTAVGDKMNAVKTKIQDVWNSIVDWVKTKIDGLKTSVSDKFESIKNSIGDKIESAKTLVKGKIDSIVGFFQDLPGRILRGLGNIASQIADKLTPDLPGVVGGAISGIAGWLHASGGVFSRPHVGIVAERGPEAIVPLSNPRRAMQVMNEAGLTQMAARSGPLVQMHDTVIQDATDADLVAQRTVASMAALLVAS